MIEGVAVRQLSSRVDERGRVQPLWRQGVEGVPAFGQVHLVTVYPGVIKGWHRHRETTDLLACVQGAVRIGLYDEREGSKTAGQLNGFFLGDHQPLRLTVPPGVWFGIKGVGTREALLVVQADRPWDERDPDQETMDPEVNEIPFDWSLRDG